MGQYNNSGHGLLSCFFGHPILLEFCSHFRSISPLMHVTDLLDVGALHQTPLKPRDPKEQDFQWEEGSAVRIQQQREMDGSRGEMPSLLGSLGGDAGLSAGEASRALAPVCQRLQGALYQEVGCRCLRRFPLAQLPHPTPSPSRRVCELSIL